MSYELTENTRESRFEAGIKIPAPLNFYLIEGVKIHVEFEISQETSKCINAKMKFIIEGEEWGRSLRENQFIVHQTGGNVPFLDIDAAEIAVNYSDDKDRPNAIKIINEWIDQKHLEMYNTYINKKLMKLVVK